MQTQLQNNTQEPEAGVILCVIGETYEPWQHFARCPEALKGNHKQKAELFLSCSNYISGPVWNIQIDKGGLFK